MDTENKSKQKENHTKPLRLFKIEQAIQNMSYPSVEKLQKELEVSRRTILRDIDELKIYYNAPIEYDRMRKGYYYSDNTYFVKNMMLTESEVFAVTGILPLMERYNNTPLKNTITKVYETLAQMLPNQVEVQSNFMNDVEFIAEPIPCISEEVFNSVFKATKLHKIMQFGYRSISATDYKPHELYPYKIYNQKGDWYVLGYSPKHDKFATFTLARMKDIELGDSFEPDPDFKNKIHVDPNFGIWNNDSKPQKIELLFDKSINTYILERTWHKNQECKQNEDGTVYLTFESNQIQETLYWVLRFGASVTVLNPTELKEMYAAEVRKMAEKL
ncbi:YafY family protein [Treponema sp. C6A8]|uniref:helix-turn-helix transcriptional regulator n=1 Tax=Treponema sp. C6A8 TaxID=1410609 RepID=UPI00047FC76C|nr:WYL domain-containing protein [Treponema sp. C6A8]